MADIFDLDLECCLPTGGYQLQKEPVTYGTLKQAEVSAKKYLQGLLPYRGERVYLKKNNRQIGLMKLEPKGTKVYMYE